MKRTNELFLLVPGVIAALVQLAPILLLPYILVPRRPLLADLPVVLLLDVLALALLWKTFEAWVLPDRALGWAEQDVPLDAPARAQAIRDARLRVLVIDLLTGGLYYAIFAQPGLLG